MTPLTSSPATRWTAAQTRDQFRAVTVLRWQIFRNNLRRKSGKGDLFALIIITPVFLGLLFGPSVGLGFASFYAVSHNQPALLTGALWGIFAVAQFISIQIGAPETVFDPTQLIRFPLAFRGYAILRVFFGLVSPSSIALTLWSIGVATGVAFASADLALWGLFAMAAFWLANIFFTRMVFSWVDRWLSTRRAREIFTGLIFVFSLGIQWLNFTFNPAYSRTHASSAQIAARIHTAQHVYAVAQPVLAKLPPGLVVATLTNAAQHHALAALFSIFGVLVYAAAFFAIFAIRLHREFRGENLSDAANAVATSAPLATRTASAAAVLHRVPEQRHDEVPSAVITTNPADAAPQPPANPIVILLGKEFLTLRRTTGILYGLLAPLILVLFFVAKLSARTPGWFLFPACVAYTLFGCLPMAYNTLGMEAAGVQFYFLAPLGMKPVMISKNLLTGALVLIEIVVVYGALAFAGHPPDFALTLSVLLWALATSFVSFATGNARSISAPKKIDLNKPAGKQAAPLSALLAVGILMLTGTVGGALLGVAHFMQHPWLLPPAMLVLAAFGAWIYFAALQRTDRKVAKHRDTLLEILCKGG